MNTRTDYTFRSPQLRRLGYAGMLALLVLAAVFYRERAWLLDVAFQTFLMINEGTVQVMVNRFGSALVQLLPLSAIRLGASIPVVSWCYSVSFPLLYLVFYALTVRVLRNDYLGWAIVWLYTLIVFDAFYWATSEQQQGLGAVLVFYAYWLRYPGQERPWMWAVSAVGVVALAYYHPLIFVSFYFLWVFFALHLGRRVVGWAYGALALWMGIVQGVKAWISSNWYDAAKYSSFSDNLRAYFPRYWELPANGKFLEHALTIWYAFPLLLLTMTVCYGYRRQWAKLAWIWVSCVGYLLLLHIGAPQSTYRFYVEVNYMALIIFVGVPFLFDVAPLLRERTLFLLLAVVLVFRIGVIGLHHAPFKARYEWIARTLHEQPAAGNRLFLPEAAAPMDTLLMSWGIPYESLLITAANDVDSVKTLLIHPNPDDFAAQWPLDTVFITPFQTYPVQALNERYFPLGKGVYRRTARK